MCILRSTWDHQHAGDPTPNHNLCHLALDILTVEGSRHQREIAGVPGRFVDGIDAGREKWIG